MSDSKQIALGVQVKDRVSGFTGIVVARAEYLFCTSSYCIVPLATDNKYEEGKWIDQGKLIVVGSGLTSEESGEVSQ